MQVTGRQKGRGRRLAQQRSWCCHLPGSEDEKFMWRHLSSQGLWDEQEDGLGGVSMCVSGVWNTNSGAVRSGTRNKSEDPLRFEIG